MNASKLENLKADLETKLGTSLDCSQDEFFINLKTTPGNLVSLLQVLKDKLGLNYLANLTSVDYGEEFEIIYHIYGIPDNGVKIAIKLRVPKNNPELPSASLIYPTADWQEREAYDLMGIRFSGHPNLLRILLPDSFKGHPLRKDYKKEADGF